MATTSESGALIAADIFQILISDDRSDAPIPEPVERNMRLAREAHPYAHHHLLKNDDVVALLGAHFETEVLAAYERLAPFSFRCDLARYCVLLVHGGLYVDLGVRFISGLIGPRDSGLVGFRDYWHSARHGNAICNGLLLAKAGRPELKTAIDMIVANVRNRYYGATPIDISGPALLARAIARHDDGASYSFGQYFPVAPETRLRNFVFMSEEGEIVALGKSGPGGNIAYLGLAGVNDYGEIWRARRVYGETASKWPHDARELSTNVGSRQPRGIVYESSDPGFVVFGPYCTLAPGAYRAALHFEAGSTVAHCAFEVTCDVGAKQLAFVPQGQGYLESSRLVLDFQIDFTAANTECRMWTDGEDSWLSAFDQHRIIDAAARDCRRRARPRRSNAGVSRQLRQAPPTSAQRVFKAPRPAYFACPPNSSSMRMS